MKKTAAGKFAFICICAGCFVFLGASVKTSFAATPLFKVIGFYSDTVEQAHKDYAHAAIQFYTKLAAKNNFQFDSTKDWKNNCNYAFMSQYDAVLWLNLFTYTDAQHTEFQKYMENGGAWMGFHASGYYDASTNWPWEQTFIHQGNYCKNNWPPASVKLITDDQTHPATIHVAKNWTGPVNEYYQWCPSPRLTAGIKVLVSIDPTALPFGNGDGQHASDVIPKGVDVPVIWTNTAFKRMIYCNIGHGALAVTSNDSNMSNFLTDAIMWLGTKPTSVKSANPFKILSDMAYKLDVNTGKNFITLSVPAATSISATLTDVNGRVIEKAQGMGFCKLNRNAIPSGMYVLSANYLGATVSQKMFLQ